MLGRAGQVLGQAPAGAHAVEVPASGHSEVGVQDEAALETMHEQIKAEIDEAIAWAEASPAPSPDALYEDVTVAPHVPQE